ncbi:MAG TPA: hypothetical protein VNK41_00680 [Vicinamibacterales bacterium]|nr:hypothetical protein [Vicinamibacterales bacterium]
MVGSAGGPASGYTARLSFGARIVSPQTAGHSGGVSESTEVVFVPGGVCAGDLSVIGAKE